MNGFLVIGVLHGYDVPLALFEDREVAEDFAEDQTPGDVLDALKAAWGQWWPKIALKPVGVVLCVVREGDPQPWELVKEFGDE